MWNIWVMLAILAGAVIGVVIVFLITDYLKEE